MNISFINTEVLFAFVSGKQFEGREIIFQEIRDQFVCGKIGWYMQL